MQISTRLILLIAVTFFILSCTNEQTRKFWNGEYSGQAAIRAYDKKKEVYYASKSPEWLAQQDKNREICHTKTSTMPVKYSDERSAKLKAYTQCMEERGTPLYSS